MDHRREVQQFLTAARGRLTPEKAGVPMFGGERRVPGLRREEVAQLAGVSLTYYTRMERGDLAGASDSVLHALARGLQLNDAETQHLFDLARATEGPIRRTRTPAEPRMSPAVTHLIDAMRDVPVIASNLVRDPVASNSLGRALFPHLFPEGRPPLNQAVYMFLDPRARTFYSDWETTARGAVSNLRLAAGHDPSNKALMSLIGKLATQSDEFRTWWGGHTVRIHNSGSKAINHPVVGPITVNYEVLEIASAPHIGITSYLAEPGTPSADALNLLRSWIAEPSSDRTDTSHISQEHPHA